MYKISDIAAAISRQSSLKDRDAAIQYLSTDSRRISFPTSVLFFALETRQRNGHDFIAESYHRGVRNFVVKEGFGIESFPEGNFLFVNDTLTALQQAAAFHRGHFNIPVIGITGSNGKTIVKEWLAQLLQQEFEIARSPRSYNSQVGVPLSVWQLHKKHSLALFEAGISQPGEMQKLEKVIRPTIGIFTNIGEAHNEGFINMSQKVSEKMELFNHVELLVYNADDKLITQSVNFRFTREKFSYGLAEGATLRILSINKTDNQTTIVAQFKNREIQATIPLTDDASVQNAIICWCILLHFSIPDAAIAERMLHLHSVDMRMQLKQSINGCYLINDAYSMDVSSLSIALDFLLNQKQSANKTVILSDLPKGNDFFQYQHIAHTLAESRIGRVVLIGPDWERHLNLFQGDFNAIEHYSSTQSFINQFNETQFRNEIILLKGARVFEFEKIAALLDIKVHQTLLEINLNAMVHNLNQHKKLLQPGTKMMAMVKAFGYGSGSAEIANILQFHKVDYLAVAYADEGVELRKAGIHIPILVLNIDEAAFNSIVDYNLEPEIFSFTLLRSFSLYLMRHGLHRYPVHIKLDTGMHRLGFEESEFERLTLELSRNQQVKVQSVLSHFAASEDAVHDSYTNQQFELFSQCCSAIEAAVGYNFIKHIGNSAAIYRHKQMQMDMVRLGIGLYGVDLTQQLQLQPVATLKTTVAQVKQLKAGETVGYSRRGVLQRDSVIATIRIGYADGFSRQLGNGKGRVYLHDQFARVVGSVCMDMVMIDVTDIPGVAEGDVVEIFGNNISVEEVAANCDTIPYEILTGISHRVKRIYIEQ